MKSGNSHFKILKNIKVFIQPGGSHTARILNMPKDMRDEILDQLNEWMEYK